LAPKQRATRVTREQYLDHAIRMAEFQVRWSRPNVDVVRVGKGHAIGVSTDDGSVTISDQQNGGIRSIMPQYVERSVKVKTKRSTRNVWKKWTDDDSEELVKFMAREKVSASSDEDYEDDDAD
jgi:hypothetical protein